MRPPVIHRLKTCGCSKRASTNAFERHAVGQLLHPSGAVVAKKPGVTLPIRVLAQDQFLRSGASPHLIPKNPRLELTAMFKKILVAADGSDHANQAVEVAASLSEKFGSKLTVLHIMPHAGSHQIPDELPEKRGSPTGPVPVCFYSESVPTLFALCPAVRSSAS